MLSFLFSLPTKESLGFFSGFSSSTSGSARGSGGGGLRGTGGATLPPPPAVKGVLIIVDEYH